MLTLPGTDLSIFAVGALLAALACLWLVRYHTRDADWTPAVLCAVLAAAGAYLVDRIVGENLVESLAKGMGASAMSAMCLLLVLPAALGAGIIGGVCAAAIGKVRGSAPIGIALSAFGGMSLGSSAFAQFNLSSLAGKAGIPVGETIIAGFWLSLGVAIVTLVIGVPLGLSGAAGARDPSQRPSQGGPSPAPAPVPAIKPIPFRQPQGDETGKATVIHSEIKKPVATAWLVVTIGAGKGTRFDLHDGDNTIGRKRSCDVALLGDEEVSREHCLLRGAGAQFQLHDLAAHNGTFMNGTQVHEPRTMQDGDEIRVGNTTLVFKKV